MDVKANSYNSKQTKSKEASKGIMSNSVKCVTVGWFVFG